MTILRAVLDQWVGQEKGLERGSDGTQDLLVRLIELYRAWDVNSLCQPGKKGLWAHWLAIEIFRSFIKEL
jgi:hypothetical protein